MATTDPLPSASQMHWSQDLLPTLARSADAARDLGYIAYNRRLRAMSPKGVGGSDASWSALILPIHLKPRTLPQSLIGKAVR